MTLPIPMPKLILCRT